MYERSFFKEKQIGNYNDLHDEAIRLGIKLGTWYLLREFNIEYDMLLPSVSLFPAWRPQAGRSVARSPR